MTELKTICPKCQSAMETGFLPDAAHGQQVWFEGEAPTTLRGSLMKGRKRFVVVAHRCTACGYLESYARS